MIDEKKLKGYIEAKCIEVCNRKDDMDFIKDQFVRHANIIREGNNFYLSSISSEVEKLRIASEKYFELDFNVSQICHVLGDEYVEIYKKICGNS